MSVGRGRLHSSTTLNFYRQSATCKVYAHPLKMDPLVPDCVLKVMHSQSLWKGHHLRLKSFILSFNDHQCIRFQWFPNGVLTSVCQRVVKSLLNPPTNQKKHDKLERKIINDVAEKLFKKDQRGWWTKQSLI